MDNPVPTTVRRAVGIPAILVIVVSIVRILSTAAVTERVTGVLPPDTQHHNFASNLVRNLAITGLLCSGFVIVAWRWLAACPTGASLRLAGAAFAEKVGLESFPERYTEYVRLPRIGPGWDSFDVLRVRVDLCSQLEIETEAE